MIIMNNNYNPDAAEYLRRKGEDDLERQWRFNHYEADGVENPAQPARQKVTLEPSGSQQNNTDKNET